MSKARHHLRRLEIFRRIAEQLQRDHEKLRGDFIKMWKRDRQLPGGTEGFSLSFSQCLFSHRLSRKRLNYFSGAYWSPMNYIFILQKEKNIYFAPSLFSMNAGNPFNSMKSQIISWDLLLNLVGHRFLLFSATVIQQCILSHISQLETLAQEKVL